MERNGVDERKSGLVTLLRAIGDKVLIVECLISEPLGEEVCLENV